MKISELTKSIRTTILYNIELGSLAEVEIRRHGIPIGYITGYKSSDYKVTLHDGPGLRKMKVIDLLSALRRIKSERGRSDKDVTYSPRYGYNYDIISVYLKLIRSGNSVEYVKFYINVQ